jgi:hypothetical protein
MVAMVLPFSKVVISHHVLPHPITPIVGTTVRGVLYAVISAPILIPQEVTADAVVAAFASGLVVVGSVVAVCAYAARGSRANAAAITECLGLFIFVSFR